MLFFRTFALLTASAQAATTIDKVFSVKTGTGPGSCDRTYNRAQNGGSAKYIDTLTAFWEDTAMLVEQARKGLDRYTENNVHGLLVRRHLAGWFGIEFDFDGTSHGPKGQDDRSRLENIVDTFTELVSLVNGNFVFADPDRNDIKKRHLYCDSDWAMETDMVYDINGVPQYRKKRDANGNQVAKSVHVASEFQHPGVIPELFQKQGRGWKAYAYYMPDFKAYFFLKTSERHDPGAGKRHLCASGQTLALTDATALENHGGGLTLTFCPIAFTKDCDPDEQRGFCQDTSGPARINNQVPNTVRGKQPRSLTMLHELVHVTLGPEDSPDKIGNDDIYGVPLVQKHAMQRSDLTDTPEPYSYFAYSYWLSTVKANPNDQNEQLMDWSSGSPQAFQAQTP